MEKKLLIESGGVLRFGTPLKEEEGGDGSAKWSAPVWRLGVMNLNGRTYPLELAQRIVEESPVTVAYDGHNVDMQTGEEYGIAKAVCSNPRIEGNELWVDIDFVDKDYEALLKSLMDRGVSIGVSSVGWGDMDKDGVVIAESYELVRFLDFVLSPAGEVYAKIGEKAGRTKPGRSVKTVVKTEADEAVAERRSRVAAGLAEIFTRSYAG